MNLKNVLKKILIPGEKLSHRAISATIWMTISRIGNKLLFLIRTIVLARILAPKDFGLFGIALIVLSFLQNFSQTGMLEALIQKKHDINSYLNLAWTVKLLRGVILAISLFLLAPWLAKFFGEPLVKNLIYIIGISLIFAGIGNPAIVFFTKELEFQKNFVYETIGTLADLIVSIILVFVMRNALALAYGYLAGIVALTVVSYFMHSHRPRFNFEIEKFKELTNFGRWVWGYSTVGFLLSQGVGFFIGKALGAQSLGFYQMAIRFAEIATIELAMVFSAVCFPFYAKLQDDESRLRQSYYKTLKVIMVIVTPISFFLYYFASSITEFILGSKWLSISPLISIFAIYGIITSLCLVNYSLLKSVGRPDITTKLGVLKLLILTLLIYPVSIKWGLKGISLLLLFVQFIAAPIELAIVNYKLKLDKKLIFKILGMPIGACIAAFLPVSFFSNIVLHNQNLPLIIINTVIVLLLYFGIFFMADKYFNYGLKRLMNREYILKLLGVS